MIRGREGREEMIRGGAQSREYRKENRKELDGKKGKTDRVESKRRAEKRREGTKSAL
jgi:hypothetical protein